MKESVFALLFEGSRHDLGLFDLGHWRWTHTRTSIDRRGQWRTSTSGHNGFPDYTCVRERLDGTFQLIFIELKGDGDPDGKKKRGVVTPEQAEWHRLLRDAGQTVYVWWPEDIEEAEKVLLP